MKDTQSKKSIISQKDYKEFKVGDLVFSNVHGILCGNLTKINAENFDEFLEKAINTLPDGHKSITFTFLENDEEEKELLALCQKNGFTLTQSGKNLKGEPYAVYAKNLK